VVSRAQLQLRHETGPHSTAEAAQHRGVLWRHTSTPRVPNVLVDDPTAITSLSKCRRRERGAARRGSALNAPPQARRRRPYDGSLVPPSDSPLRAERPLPVCASTPPPLVGARHWPGPALARQALRTRCRRRLCSARSSGRSRRRTRALGRTCAVLTCRLGRDSAARAGTHGVLSKHPPRSGTHSTWLALPSVSAQRPIGPQWRTVSASHLECGAVRARSRSCMGVRCVQLCRVLRVHSRGRA
jgi:hypothetical protein